MIVIGVAPGRSYVLSESEVDEGVVGGCGDRSCRQDEECEQPEVHCRYPQLAPSLHLQHLAAQWRRADDAYGERDDFDTVHVVDEVVHRLSSLCPEHGQKVMPGIIHGVRPEDDESQHDYEHGIKMLQRLASDAFSVSVPSGQGLNEDEEAVVKAPHDEGPTGTMPEAGREPDDEERNEGHDGIGNFTSCLFHHPPVATRNDGVTGERQEHDRHEHIVPEPASQRYVPASPVFGDTARDVRVVEVFQKFEPEDGAEADGHVRVSAEVVVDLEGIADRSQPGGHAVQLIDRLGKHLVGDSSQRVGEKDLLGESHDEAFHAVGDLLKVHGSVLDLVGYVVVLDDRSSYQLREEGDVERKFIDVLLRCNFLSIDIHDVADGLEGVEGDADGHDDLDEVDMPSEKRVDVFNEEVEVLEVEQEAQIAQDGEQKSQFGSRT